MKSKDLQLYGCKYMKAVNDGDLSKLKCLYNNGYGHLYDKLLYVAAEKEHWDVFKWIHSINSFGGEDLKMLVDEAMEENDLSKVKWICHEDHYASMIFLVINSVGEGKFDLLKWMHSKGICLFEYNASDEAIISGNLEILKWLYLIGIPMDDFHLELCLQNEQLEIFDWLYSILDFTDFSREADIIQNTKTFKYVSVVEKLEKVLNLTGYDSLALYVALEGLHLESAKFLIECGCTLDDSHAHLQPFIEFLWNGHSFECLYKIVEHLSDDMAYTVKRIAQQRERKKVDGFYDISFKFV